MPLINIETLDDPVQLERVQTFRGGMNSFDTPENLPSDTSQILENMLVPDNLVVRTREGADPIAGNNAPTGGIIQGLFWFNPPAYSPGIVAICNAIFSSYVGGAWSAVTVTGGSNWGSTTRMAIAQGVDKLYVSDGVDGHPWVQWTGTGNATKLGTNVGTGGNIGDPPMGAGVIFWIGSRMFATAFPNGLTNYNNDTLCCSLVLAAGNASWDNVIWSVRIGGGDGDPIISAIPMQNNWILVLKQKSLWLVYADPTATSAAGWTVQNLTREIGCVGARAATINGNDIMFLAKDGIRSVRRMAIGVDEYEVVPPASEHVKSITDRINWQYANLVSAWRYKQWILFSLPLDGATTNTGVLVFNTRTQTWMGLWNNPQSPTWNVTQFATAYGIGANNADVLLLGDTSGHVNKWKDDQDATLAATFLDNAFPYQSRLRSRTFQFQDTVATKDAWYMELRLLNVAPNNSGGFTINVNLFTDDNQFPSVVLAPTITAAILGQIVLPFVLAGNSPYTTRVPLDVLPDFNQLYVDFVAPVVTTVLPGGRIVYTGGGLIEIKNFTIAAFLNTISNDSKSP
jgi:hypothetical protein